jgi:RNA polymerase sigma factor (sigma-70 family)
MHKSRGPEEELRRMLDSYAQYMNIQVQLYNLPQYGLDPEDILQEVKIRIWKLIQSKKTIVTPPSYIRRIISSAVIDQLRKLRRDDGLYRHERQICISERQDPYCREAVRRKAMEEMVGQAVNRLINSRRQVVKLYLMNLTIPEISSYLKWSHDKTRNLLYRGLADLRVSLRDMDAENENRR